MRVLFPEPLGQIMAASVRFLKKKILGLGHHNFRSLPKVGLLLELLRSLGLIGPQD